MGVITYISLSLSLVTKSCLTFATTWTVECQAPLSMGFSRQEYWSGLPFPSPGDLPDSGSEPGLPHCRQILYQLSYEGTWSPQTPNGEGSISYHPYLKKSNGNHTFTMRSVFAFDWYYINWIWQCELPRGQGLLCNKYGWFVGQNFYYFLRIIEVIKGSVGKQRVTSYWLKRLGPKPVLRAVVESEGAYRICRRLVCYFVKNYTQKIFMTWITTMVWSVTQSQTSWNVKSSGPSEASLWTKLVEAMEFQLSCFKF